MEFVAKLDDQISAPSAAAAEAQLAMGEAIKGADERLKILDATQKKAAKSAAVSAAAFNPKVYQQQVLAERQLAAAKDKALEGLGLGLSKKEQAEKAAAKEAEAEQKRSKDAAAREAKAQEATKRTAAEERKRVREMTAQRAAAGLSGAASQAKALALSLGAVAGVSGGLGLAKIAIGYQGMARLQMITYQSHLQIRSLFRGVDSRPLERAYLQFTKLFSLSTVTGQAISKGLTRGFNGFFSAVEKAEPYFSGFVRGVVLGALKVEGAWLRARIFLFPLTDAIEDATGKIDGIKLAAYGGVAAVGLLAAKGLGLLSLGGAALSAGGSMLSLAASTGAAGLAAAGAAAPWLAFAAAIGAVVAAGYQFVKLVEEWDTDLILRSLGIGGGESDADRLNRQYDEEAAARKKAGKPSLVRMADQAPATPVGAPAPAPQAPVDQATGAGRRAGAAMGAGMVAGMKSQEAAVAAGGAGLVDAGERGAKDAADIHSPSRLFRREVGAQMGEGARLGLKDSGKGVQEQAAVSLVPSPRAAGAGAPAASAGPSVQLTFTGDIIVGGVGDRQEIRESFDEAMLALAQQVSVMLGVPRVGVANGS